MWPLETAFLSSHFLVSPQLLDFSLGTPQNPHLMLSLMVGALGALRQVAAPAWKEAVQPFTPRAPGPWRVTGSRQHLAGEQRPAGGAWALLP